ncbi:MAG: hypothetical protein V2J24_07325 [Pseudomonadales bacterium]|jgi:hypothetical protein|nr:hypothetical protein [Pseudomonadales bacterium]
MNESEPSEEKPFRLGRLLAWLAGVILALMAAAAVIDIAVLGW